MKKNLKRQNLAKKTTNGKSSDKFKEKSTPGTAKRKTPVLKTAAEAPEKQPVPSGAPSSIDAVPEALSDSTRASRQESEGNSQTKRPAKRRVQSARERLKPALKIPPILLEGDSPVAPSMSGPGSRYALAPQPVASAKATQALQAGELPEAYGTGRIFLAARDPRWLYASWDVTREQQRALNAQSREGHLVLRIFSGAEMTPAIPEVHVHPESKHWFVNVPRPETRYRAEIGFYSAEGSWETVSVSPGTFTPSDAPSADTRAEFATIPPQVTFREVVEAVQEIVEHKPSQPLLEAVAFAAETQKQQEIARPAVEFREPAGKAPEVAEQHAKAKRLAPQSKPHPRAALPIQIEPGRPWKPEQQRALRRLIQMDSHRRVWLGSIEITELVRRQLEEEIAAIEARKMLGEIRPEEVPGLGISSPAGGEVPRPRKFWFKVNAELIVYGATEPDAKVTIADRAIKLRPDGTFSFRFSLPDGRYQLPAVAVSGDGVEGREARLEFSRSTEYRGQVETHSQNGELRPPLPEHVH